MDDSPVVHDDMWQVLRSLTPARIGLGRAGGSLTTRTLLELEHAEAQARDAVYVSFDSAGLASAVEKRGWAALTVQSAAPTRSTFLQRPDLGRRLDRASQAKLVAVQQASAGQRYDLGFVLGDGLAAQAVEQHALPVLDMLYPSLKQAGWQIAPVVVATQARVALADEIGSLLACQQVVILLGERPGLSAADSLGAYLTYAPQIGRTDAERNCVSNIRPVGLAYAAAARKLHALMQAAHQLGRTGIDLKEDSQVLNVSPPPD